MVYLKLTADDQDGAHVFQIGDVIRFAVCVKKNCAKVMLRKDFIVTKEATEVEIVLDGDDTNFGNVISKPTDFWYEVSLNPETDPRTIIGYDTEGARIFRLYPEIDEEGKVEE